MPTIPAPVVPTAREEWPDADFDLREGDQLRNLHVESDKEDDDMDWDEEMDLGETGAKAQVFAANSLSQVAGRPSGMITIRPPLTSQEEEDEDDDDEGLSTIRMAALPQPQPLSYVTPSALIDEDIESAFALPSDLTQLSLAPLPLSHRSSKNSLEWGDKDQTSSSHSSDAYSTFGFGAAASSSSNSVTTVSLLDSEESGCDDVSEGELDGLVIPSGMFDKGQSGKYLKKVLELKKTAQVSEQQEKAASPNPDDDFESGLVIEDDGDFSPSRLLITQHSKRPSSRSKSAPARPNLARPPSRARNDRAKSPVNPPISSARQLQRIKLSSSPPPQPAISRIQSYKEALSSTQPAPNAATLLSAKPGSLRGQKSHTGLKPPTPPSTQRKQLTRKASLSSLMETSSQALGTGSAPVAGPSTTKAARYEAPTAASRAKSHTSSTSRMHQLDYMVPPTRPTTPSSNPAALRLTMPTAMRSKSRPSLSAVFAASPTTVVPPQPTHRATSPIPLRPPSTQSLRTRGSQPRPQSNVPPAPAPKLLRKPKRLRTYGDGTELDGFDDLPTDRDKEGQYRVQPKGVSRISGSAHSKASEKEPPQERKKGRRESIGSDLHNTAFPSSLRRTARIEFPSEEKPLKKKKEAYSPSEARRKPTLIRQMGGINAPKVVGEMKWNPSTLRWEGNDQALRDFDAAVGTSTRPALITHLTGSSIGSPVGTFAAGARKVGNMIFDPTRMCWISTLPADEEEPDVFADLADDEDDDVWETKGGTIRASQQTAGITNPCEPSLSSVATALTVLSPASSRTRTISESGDSDRGSRASIFFDVDDDFVERCRAAEERHRSEMKGWRSALLRQVDAFGEPDRQDLYEIRALATRKY